MMKEYPLFRTYPEYKEIDPKDIISRLIKYKNFKLAANVSKFLDYGIEKVIYKYVIAIMKRQIKNLEDNLGKPVKQKGKDSRCRARVRRYADRGSICQKGGCSRVRS